jgi:hypothetical protein
MRSAYGDHESKENWFGVGYSTFVEKKMHTEFLQECVKGRDNLDDMDDRIMLKRILKIGMGGRGFESRLMAGL